MKLEREQPVDTSDPAAKYLFEIYHGSERHAQLAFRTWKAVLETAYWLDRDSHVGSQPCAFVILEPADRPGWPPVTTLCSDAERKQFCDVVNLSRQHGWALAQMIRGDVVPAVSAESAVV